MLSLRVRVSSRPAAGRRHQSHVGGGVQKACKGAGFVSSLAPTPALTPVNLSRRTTVSFRQNRPWHRPQLRPTNRPYALLTPAHLGELGLAFVIRIHDSKKEKEELRMSVGSSYIKVSSFVFASSVIVCAMCVRASEELFCDEWRSAHMTQRDEFPEALTSKRLEAVKRAPASAFLWATLGWSRQAADDGISLPRLLQFEDSVTCVNVINPTLPRVLQDS